MLTGDLLRVTHRQGRVTPRLADPAHAGLRERAAALIAAVEAHRERSRGELERALDLLAPTGGQHQLERGLAKLLLDRCTFETRAQAEPAALRRDVFDRAAAAWRERGLERQGTGPASGQAGGQESGQVAGRAAGGAGGQEAGQVAGLAAWRADVLAEAGAAHGLTLAAAEDTLYADLEANQVLTAFEAIAPERLLLRYNVALVQGLLLRADGLEVRAAWPEPARLRQLFRWLKFFGLLFEVRREGDRGEGGRREGARRDGAQGARAQGNRGGLVLAVDGPLRVLEHASRYGMNLAQFFAALLLWPGAWRLTAQVRTGRRLQPATLELEPHPWLKSPLPETGAWVPEAVRDFVAAFNKRAAAGVTQQPAPGRDLSAGQTTWRAEPAQRVLLLPGNAYLIPDFELVETATGRRILLEHVLHPAPERLERLLGLADAALRTPGAAPARHGTPGAEIPGAASASSGELAPPADYWFACKRAAGLPEHPRLLAYRRTLLAGPVLERLEAGADDAASPGASESGKMDLP